MGVAQERIVRTATARAILAASPRMAGLRCRYPPPGGPGGAQYVAMGATSGERRGNVASIVVTLGSVLLVPAIVMTAASGQVPVRGLLLATGLLAAIVILGLALVARRRGRPFTERRRRQ